MEARNQKLARPTCCAFALTTMLGVAGCGGAITGGGEAAPNVGPAVSGPSQLGLGSHTFKNDVAGRGSNPMTTAAIDTHVSGSTFVLFVGTGVERTDAFQSVHDNMGNTYTQIGVAQPFAHNEGALRTFICSNCKGGAGHTFSLTKTRELSRWEAVLFAVEVTGAPTLDSFAQANAQKSPLSAGSVTTTQAGDMLLVCALAASYRSPDKYTPSAGYVLLDDQANGSNSLGGADAWALAGAAGTYGGTLKSSLASSGAIFLVALAPPLSSFTISGTVDGATAANVPISLAGAAAAATTTDGNGNYAFSGLADGSYTVTPSQAGYAFTPPSIPVTVSGANVPGQNFTAAATYDISAVVSGAPPGTTITLSGLASASTSTAADGTFSFSGLLNGDYVLTPSLVGYSFYPPALHVTVSGSSQSGLDLTAYPTCTESRWCWQGPVPRVPDIHAVWGSSASDVWMVGDGGAPLHWDGSTWTNWWGGVPNGLGGISGTATNDVWAVGSAGTIVHWDGNGWTRVASNTTSDLFAVWANTPTSAWAVGSDGTIVQLSGATWSPVTSGVSSYLYGVWGSGPSDVWAVGDAGAILHYNGSGWTTSSSGVTNSLYGVWGSGPGSAWAVGDTGTILQLVGSTWTQSPQSQNVTTNYLYGIWGSGSGAAWAVGDAGALLRLTGNTWTSVSSGHSGYLSGVWGSGGEAWAVGEAGTVLEWTGAAWGQVFGGLNSDLYAVGGTASTDVWAVGGEFGSTGMIEHWNGTAWSSATLPASTPTLYGVWASTTAGAWAVGAGGTILHWDGSAWTSATSGTSVEINAVWGSSPADVWAVGNGGTILHWNGSTWSGVTSNTLSYLLGVWGISATDVWAVGESGTAVHWDGTSWTVAPSAATATPSDLYGVWGSASTDVWAVGASGAIVQWTGTWNPVVSPTSDNLYGVGGMGSNVWATGDSGTLLGWNGTSWAAEPSGATRFIYGVFGSGSNAWAVGGGGTILEYSP